MPQLSIVVPAYNEAPRLPNTLPRLVTFCREHGSAELVVVDDGSQDRTAALIEELAQTYPFIRLLRNPGNRGKGYSVRHGMLQAKGEWILFSDADLSSPIDEFYKLMSAANEHRTVIAIGSRAVDRSLVGVHQAPLRELSGRLFNVVMRLATGLPFRDTQCGFKLFRRDAAHTVFSRLLLEGFGFDVEALMIARIHGLHAVEVAVRWDNVEGTRVSPFNGARAFFDLAVVRWNQLCGKYR